MKTTEIKTQLHELIEHLDDAQLKKLHDILDKEFPGEKPVGNKPSKRKLGIMKSQIVFSEDWDSDQVNEEIARTFNEGKIIPKA